MTRVYIMGPMTGKPDMNREAFRLATQMTAERGMMPVNPHDIETPGPDDEPMEHMYRRVMPGDIFALSSCDFVLALPGWERSKGSALEAHAADLMGIPLITMDDDTTEYFGPLEYYINNRLDEIEDHIDEGWRS